MDKACRIILVRHGESINNKQNIIGGDSPLTLLGRKQAQFTKQSLKDIYFDEVYSSDLKRAVETAEIISGKSLPSSHKLAELRERDFGSLEKKSNKYHDEEHEIRLTLEHKDNWVYKHVDDMENDEEVSTRFLTALENLAEHNLGKTILIAAHGAAIRTSLMKLKGWTYQDIPQGSFKNAGYVELMYTNNKFKVISIFGSDSL